MCTYSVVSQYGMQRYAPEYWTPKTWPPFQKLLDQAAIVDEVTKQPDCADKHKVEWVEQVEERLRILEANAKREVKIKKLAEKIDALRKELQEI